VRRSFSIVIAARVKGPSNMHLVSLSRRTLLMAAGASLLVAPRAASAEDSHSGAGWIAVRSYALKPETDRAALVAETEANFVPLIQGLDGFVSYYVLQPDPLTWTAISVWHDEAASNAALTPIRTWVEENVADRLASGPVGVEGAAAVIGFGPEEMMATPVAGGAPSYATHHTYAFKPGADREAVIAATQDDFLPLARSLDGFESFYALTPEPDGWVAIMIWRDQAASDAAAPQVRAWIEENVLQSFSGEPVSTPGAVDVAAFSVAAVMATPEA
jgi:heme-degrading monooxygenase HmoA